MPDSSLRRFLPVAGAALVALAGILGYEAGRMGTGEDPGLPSQPTAAAQEQQQQEEEQSVLPDFIGGGDEDDEDEDDGDGSGLFGGAEAPETRQS